MDGTLEGLLRLAAITAALAAAFGALLYAGPLARFARRLGRALHVVRPWPLRPAGPPLERTVADLRRIRDDLRHTAPGMPIARRRGVLAAYDDALLDACRALEVRASLDQLPEGLPREVERFRLEEELRRSGVPE